MNQLYVKSKTGWYHNDNTVTTHTDALVIIIHDDQNHIRREKASYIRQDKADKHSVAYKQDGINTTIKLFKRIYYQYTTPLPIWVFRESILYYHKISFFAQFRSNDSSLYRLGSYVQPLDEMARYTVYI